MLRVSPGCLPMLSQTTYPLWLVASGGRPHAAHLAQWRTQADAVLRQADRCRDWGDRQLRRRLQELTWEARGGRPLSKLLVEVFAIVAETSRRTLTMQPYPVQVMAAIGLFHGQAVEMQTGEGKTLTATMPAVLRAILGKGCHIVTANDYLASRDAREMGCLYSALGLSCGCVLDQMDDEERKPAYDCDITYGTASQFGFDFLRDRLKRGTHSPYDDDNLQAGRSRGPAEVQRGHYCAIVDEADSVLIDDAVTPLLIGLSKENPLSALGLYEWSREMARHLQPTQDFIYERDKRRAVLTEGGCRRVLLTAKPAALDAVHIQRIYEHVETALSAHVGLLKDTDYVIDQGEIVIVDESTGRKMPGRKWQRGLHQAVETKERLQITEETVHAAQITAQSYFRQYEHLSGMTGTAVPARREFRKVYRLPVTRIPTHRPCRRRGLPPRIFRTMQAKWEAIVEVIADMRARGRAVLIGTPSVAESEGLAALLEARGVPHQVLNARQDAEEAFIVSRAGQAGQVTIATNMAGRGTDILIDDTVRENGGLHVIATAMHTAARIDRQLVGRGARQGDPGSFQFFLSLEDSLLQVLPPRTQRLCGDSAQRGSHPELSRSWIKLFRRAQRRHERIHRKQRRRLLKSERERTRTCRKLGLDPYIETTEES
jgi:preprotein translocase subunit SecA